MNNYFFFVIVEQNHKKISAEKIFVWYGQKKERKERLCVKQRDLTGQWTWSIGIVTIQIERIEENGYAKQI